MKLIAEPRISLHWEGFVEEKPAHSIALDGYVRGPPKFDTKTKHFNFNHHEGVCRLATRSTASQVQMAIKMGLMDCLKTQAWTYLANIFVNDPDQDTCLAVWLLQNYERVWKNKSEPLINKMIGIQDMLDTTAWLYPFDGESRTIMQLNWVFEPYTDTKTTWTLPDMDADTMTKLINNVCFRINEFTLGRADILESKNEYDIIWWWKDRKMIMEKGVYARNKLASDKITAFISYAGKRNGKYYYSIGKQSEFINFPIDKLYQHLNYIEDDEVRGGSETIGGCRNKWSSFAPEELQRIINEFLDR